MITSTSIPAGLRLRQGTAAVLAAAMLLAACTVDPFDGRTPAQAITEASASMGLTIPPRATVVGYRAGLGEHFLRIVATESQYWELLARRPAAGGSGWSTLRRMNTAGIEDWWTPHELEGTVTAERFVLQRQGGGVLAVVAGPPSDSMRTVYLYCLHP